MNPLTLINAPLPSNPNQNLKQAAYIEYLKSFAQNGLSTLEKLETQFNQHHDRSSIKDDVKIFQKIKTLVASYEVFVLEINDSCEFIQVPEFGTCIIKAFIQLIAILKWSLQHLANYKKLQLLPQPLNNQSSSRGLNQNIGSGSLNQSFSPTVTRKESPLMRNTLNGNYSAFSKKPRCSDSNSKINSNPNDIYKIKEQTTMQLKDIDQEITRISKQYKEEEGNVKNQQKDREKLQKFIAKREKEENSYSNIGLGDQSRNEEILSQIFYTLNRKGQAIKRFADLRMSSLNDSNKIEQSTEEEYESFKQQIQSDVSQKVSQAKQKLSHLFKDHLVQYEKLRRQQLVDIGVQIQEPESVKLHKFFHEKIIKKLKGDVNKLERQLESERDLNQRWKQLLEDKSTQFEGEVSKYRNQLISLEVKTKRQVNSGLKIKKQALKNQNITSIYENQHEDKSLVSIDFDDYSAYNLKDDFSLEQADLKSKFLLTKGFVSTGNRLSRTKNPMKFQQIVEKSQNFQINSEVFACSVSPTLSTNVDVIKPNELIQNLSKFRIKNQTTESSVQTSKDLLHKYISLMNKKSPPTLEPKKLIKASSVSKSQKCSLASKGNSNITSKSNTNLLTYTKKRSSHMGDLSTYYEIQTIPKNQDNSSTLCNHLLSKTSKFQQRKVFGSFIEDKDVKNDFMPIFMMGESNVDQFYKKQYLQYQSSTQTPKIQRDSIRKLKLNLNCEEKQVLKASGNHASYKSANISGQETTRQIQDKNLNSSCNIDTLKDQLRHELKIISSMKTKQEIKDHMDYSLSLNQRSAFINAKKNIEIAER